MKYFFVCCTATLWLCTFPISSSWAAILTCNGKQVVLHDQGTQIPLPTDTFAPARVKDGRGKASTAVNLWYCVVSTDAARSDKAKGAIAPGLYVFGSDGRQMGFARFTPAEAEDLNQLCDTVLLAPNGKMLAMDTGGDLQRTWLFFSFPGMQPLGRVAYLATNDADASSLPSLVWVGTQGVLVSVMQVNEQRTCGYDPCGPVSVVYHSFTSHKNSIVFAGTARCDYTLAGYDPQSRKVTARQLCLRSPQAWQKYPYGTVPTKQVVAELPDN